MKILLLDGHPDEGRYSSHLLDEYRKAIPADHAVEHVALRDMQFSPILRHGYAKRTEWEPSIQSLAESLDSCDHLVVAFPMWWGSEPAELKGLLDRLFLPGFTFAYRDGSSLWDKLMTGRSADVIATMDTPPLLLRLMYSNALVKRWKRQVLGFCGFKPVRVLCCGPIKDGAWEKGHAKWTAKIANMAASISPARPEMKRERLPDFLDPPRR